MKRAGEFFITKDEIMEVMRQNFDGIKPETYPNEFYRMIASRTIDSITDWLGQQILHSIEAEFALAEKARYEQEHDL